MPATSSSLRILLARSVPFGAINKISSRHRQAGVAFLIFGLALGIYVSNLPTSITWENSGFDSGELATVVDTLGVAHPPGYPTYIVLGRLFAFLPFGEVAYRTNLMSAFFGAAAATLLFFAALEFIILTKGDKEKPLGWPALVSAGLAAGALAFSPLFWSQATITEVYALNAFFVVAIIYLLARRANLGTAEPQGLLGDLYLPGAALLLGLGMGNHLTVALIAPPALFLVALRWSKKSLVTLPSMIVAFLLGLAIYVYLPISAAQDPPVNWGQANEASGFWWMVSGKIYRDAHFFFGTSQGEWLDNIVNALEHFIDLVYYPGIAIALAGAVYLWRRRFLVILFCISFLLLVVLYSTTYRTGDSFVLLIPAGMVLALWLGLGAYWLLTVALPWLWLRRQLKGHQRAYLPALIVASVLMIGLIPGRSLWVNYSEQDLSDDSTAVVYGQGVLQTVEPGSLLITERDGHIFSIWYSVFTSEPEPDVILITQNLLSYDWYVESADERYPGIMPAALEIEFRDRLRSLIRVNLNKRPIYITDLTTANKFIFDEFETERVAISELEGEVLYRVVGQ